MRTTLLGVVIAPTLWEIFYSIPLKTFLSPSSMMAPLRTFPTTYIPLQSLIFVSSGLIPYCSWKSVDDSLGSDHIPSIITVSHLIQSRTFFSHKLPTSKINRKLLFTTFLLAFPSLSAHLDSVISPTGKYDIFCNFLKDTITSFLAEYKSHNNNSSVQERKEIKSNNRVQSFSFTPPPAP